MRVNLHLPEIYSVLGLRDRAMRAAGAGIEGSQTRLEVETKSTRRGGELQLGDRLAAVTDVRRQRASEQDRHSRWGGDWAPPGAGLYVGQIR